MPQRPRWPNGVVHVELEVDDSGSPATFGFWLLYPSTYPLGAAQLGLLTTDFVTNLMQYFLDCMTGSAMFRTCRLTTRGIAPLRWVEVLAPNHGAGSGGVTLGVAAGIYIQGSGGGSGSGTRIHIPGIAAELVDPPGRLSEFGEQQLQFLCSVFPDWVSNLYTSGLGEVLLGTLQQRRGGQLLDPPIFDPAEALRPTLVLEGVGRRLRTLR